MRDYLKSSAEIFGLLLAVFLAPPFFTLSLAQLRDAFDISIYLIAAQLFAAACILIAIGFLLARLIRGLWFSQAGEIPPVHALFLGQLFLFFWVYARSFLNEYVLFIPVTRMDFALLLVAALAGLYKQGWLRSPGGLLRSLAGDKRSRVVLYALLILMLVIAYRELPRVVMLSSDPDQHAFFARQVERFGTIPFTQSYWGPESFRYPAGFAVLNYIWSGLSFLDVRQVVSAQPLIQVTLAIFLLLECMWRRSGKLFASRGHHILCLISVFMIFYHMLPYGLQQNHAHLEGTGRISSMLFMAAALSLLYFGFMRSAHEENRFSPALNSLLAGFISAAAFLINPANICYVLPLTALGMVMATVASAGWQKLPWLTTGAAGLAAIFLDPYCLTRFISGNGGVPYSATTAPAAVQQLTASAVAEAFKNVSVHLACNPGFLLDFFKVDYFGRAGSVSLFAAAVALGWLQYRSEKKAAVRKIIVYTPLVLLALYYITQSAALVFKIFAGDDSYLLGSYALHCNQQFVYLWMFSIVAGGLPYLYARLDAKKVFLGLFLCALAVKSFTYVQKTVRPSPRKHHAGSMGSARGEDLEVIGSIERLFAGYRQQHDLTFAAVPKILIPNKPAIMGSEKWCFPRGASRILPLYDVFPVAFFYSQGSRDYTYENYIANVCDTFNEDWLRERNIKYLFIPSDIGDGCVSRLERLVREKKVVFKSGGCYFLELF